MTLIDWDAAEISRLNAEVARLSSERDRLRIVLEEIASTTRFTANRCRALVGYAQDHLAALSGTAPSPSQATPGIATGPLGAVPPESSHPQQEDGDDGS